PCQGRQRRNQAVTKNPFCSARLRKAPIYQAADEIAPGPKTVGKTPHGRAPRAQKDIAPIRWTSGRGPARASSHPEPGSSMACTITGRSTLLVARTRSGAVELAAAGSSERHASEC